MADSSNSVLKTVIERIRGYLDDPDLEAKYSDDYIVRHVVQPAFASIMSRVNNSATNPVLQRLSFPLVQGQQYYQLPPCVGEIWRLVIIDVNGNVSQEAMPRNVYHFKGPNWMIEGNVLSFMPYPEVNYADLELWYCPSGDYQAFYCSSPQAGSATLNASKDQVLLNMSALSASGLVGSVDRRPSAYVGQMIRLLSSATSGIIEERMISTWAPTATAGQWAATLRRPFTHATASALLPSFEIGPEGSEPLYEALAAAGAMKLAGYRKVSGEHFGMIQAQYRDSMKTLMDHYSNMQMRTAKSFEKDTVDNQIGQTWRI